MQLLEAETLRLDRAASLLARARAWLRDEHVLAPADSVLRRAMIGAVHLNTVARVEDQRDVPPPSLTASHSFSRSPSHASCQHPRVPSTGPRKNNLLEAAVLSQ